MKFNLKMYTLLLSIFAVPFIYNGCGADGFKGALEEDENISTLSTEELIKQGFLEEADFATSAYSVQATNPTWVSGFRKTTILERTFYCSTKHEMHQSGQALGFQVTIPENGLYDIQVLHHTPTHQANSFYYQLPDGYTDKDRETTEFHVPKTNLAWTTIRKRALRKGNARINFRNRENNSCISRIAVTRVEKLLYAGKPRSLSGMESKKISGTTFFYSNITVGDPQNRFYDRAASFYFEVPKAGQYEVKARVIAPNGNSDSFWILVNGIYKKLWCIPNHAKSMKRTVGVYDFSKGLNKVTFSAREKGTMIADVIIKEISGNSTPSPAPVGSGGDEGPVDFDFSDQKFTIHPTLSSAQRAELLKRCDSKNRFPYNSHQMYIDDRRRDGNSSNDTYQIIFVNNYATDFYILQCKDR